MELRSEVTEFLGFRGADGARGVILCGVAFGAALLVLLVHRVILPRFGIYIGTELQPEKPGAPKGKHKRKNRRQRSTV